MAKHREVVFFEVFLAIVIVVFIVSSFHYSPKARLVPLVAGFFSLGLVLLQIKIDVASPKPVQSDQKTPFQLKFLYAAYFAIGSGALMLLFGWLGCMGMVMIGLARFWFKESWLITLAVTGSLLLFSYLLFDKVFGVELYLGVIPSFVMSFIPE